MEQVQIDAQKIINQMANDFAIETANKSTLIASQKVTIEQLQSQIQKLTEENNNVKND